MSVQGLITVLVLVGAIVFGLYNQPLLFEPQTIAVPGGSYSLPLVGVLLAVAAGVVLLMLLASAAVEGAWHHRYARLAERLAARERELAEIKSHQVDDVASKLDALRAELVETRREGVLTRSG